MAVYNISSAFISPSNSRPLQNNLRINLQRLQNEVTELRKRKATAQIKYEAEKAVSTYFKAHAEVEFSWATLKLFPSERGALRISCKKTCKSSTFCVLFGD